MGSVVSIEAYKAKQAVKKAACDITTSYNAARISEVQYENMLKRIMEGYSASRVRIVEGEPIIVMQLDNQMLFIEYDGFEITYDRDTIEAP